MLRQTTFDPTQQKNSDGTRGESDVEWRLSWLRDEHPEALLETELISNDGRLAVFRARISIPDEGAATGWGSALMSRFRDNLGLAESRAISRALSALGYGASFRYELEQPVVEEQETAPTVDFASTNGRRLTQSKLESSKAPAVQNLIQPVTSRQLMFIHAIARECGLSEEDLEIAAGENFGERDLSKLDRNAAAQLIERLQTHLQRVQIAS